MPAVNVVTNLKLPLAPTMTITTVSSRKPNRAVRRAKNGGELRIGLRRQPTYLRRPIQNSMLPQPEP